MNSNKIFNNNINNSGQLKNEKEKCVEIKKKLNKILNRRYNVANWWANDEYQIFNRIERFKMSQSLMSMWILDQIVEFEFIYIRVIWRVFKIGNMNKSLWIYVCVFCVCVCVCFGYLSCVNLCVCVYICVYVCVMKCGKCHWGMLPRYRLTRHAIEFHYWFILFTS